jgi:hypothetical protein
MEKEENKKLFDPENFSKKEFIFDLMTNLDGWEEKGKKKELKLYSKKIKEVSDFCSLDCIKIVGKVEGNYKDVNDFYYYCNTYLPAFLNKHLSGRWIDNKVHYFKHEKNDENIENVEKKNVNVEKNNDEKKINEVNNDEKKKVEIGEEKEIGQDIGIIIFFI